MAARKYVTRSDLENALQELREKLQVDVEHRLDRLHDDLKENHFQKILDAIAGIQAGDTSNMMEAIMALTGSVDRLGAVVQKLVVDGQTSQAAIQAGLDEIARLIAQGSADSTELAALKVVVGEAETALDTHVTELEALDASVADPGNPDLDPNAKV